VTHLQPNPDGRLIDPPFGARRSFVGGVELLTIRPVRIMIGATVFVMGVLSGAGIAMWVMPPV
jgi:hypothetical protein